MAKQIKIEILAKDNFWNDAVQIEWTNRHPDKKLILLDKGVYSIDNDWLSELIDVAVECNSKIVLAPGNPGRRSLFTQFLQR